MIPRLHNLKRTLHRKCRYNQYDSEINKLLQRNYAEKVPEDQLSSKNRIWYLPHQPVITEKKPGKVRVVFDCAARYHGESLNDKALRGPDLNNKLSHVLLRLRENPYAFTADVEAMYNQVKVPEADRDALRFLWFDENGIIQHYRMTSHLFGGVWCASAATYALRCIAKEDTKPQVRNTIEFAFYVDDCLKSSSTKEDAREKIHRTREALAAAGFRLIKYVANEEGLLRDLLAEDVVQKTNLAATGSDSKALGIE